MLFAARRLVRASSVSLRAFAAFSAFAASAGLLTACGGNDVNAGKCMAAKSPTAAAGDGALAQPKPGDTDGELRYWLAGAQRSDKNKARDAYRHPRETLEFFGIRDNQNVIELSPGAGWYTEILAPFLKDRGHLSVTSVDPNGPPDAEGTKQANALLNKFKADPATFGKVGTVRMDDKTPLVLGPDNTADLVLTFRNLHNWTEDKIDDQVLNAAFKVLKPGGILGVVDHRAAANADPVQANKDGYLPEAWVIDRVQKSGFKLAEKSEINANPKDTKDYPKGVWTLPPAYQLGDQDRAKFAAIGESDRMTLKFVKP